MLKLKIKVTGIPKSKAAMLRRFNLESGGKVQQVIDKAVIDKSLAYVPWDSGTLGKSAYGATEIGSGKVVYPGPYAHYMYYGEVYGPNIPVFDDDSGTPTRFFSPPGRKKHPTGRELQYKKDVNPLAGSFWFERMKADRLQEIIKEAEDAAKGKV